MIYLVRTIKEFSTNNINTDFVIESESESEIKELMSQYRIIVLGITKVAGRPNSGQYFGIFRGINQKDFKFCLKADSLEGACSRCIDLELPLVSINDIKSPISEGEITTLIQSVITKKEAINQQQKATEDNEKQKKKEIMDDKRKEKIMIVITETLQDISRIEQEQENNIVFLDKKRKLHDLKEQLTKIKMGSNLEKATSVLEEAFSLMEVIEMENLTEMKEEEQKIMSSSIVSNVDIISELDKIKRANQTIQAGTKKTSSDLYYTYLGISGLYQKFILKDILNRFKELKQTITYAIDYIGFGYIVISIFLGFFLLYYVIQHNLNQNILLSMISIGVIGITWELPLATKKSSLFINIIYIILAIIISIIIQKLIIINFALV